MKLPPSHGLLFGPTHMDHHILTQKSVIHSDQRHGVPEVDKGKPSRAERVGDVNRTEQIGDFCVVRSCHSIL